jgi:hypothetical protein
LGGLNQPGARDVLLLPSLDSEGYGVVLGVLLDRARRFPKGYYRCWARIAAHMASGVPAHVS